MFSDLVIIVSYYLVFLSFKENPYAARTVEVFKGHKVISTGPYAVVRHPMYAGIIPMYLFMPLALGSFWAIIPSIAVVAIVIARALNEEDVLKKDLPGYKEYCKKVHYRLIPFVW
jgi:protein-S-isoprenylcysteine O-methyltransferase Ste14